MRDKLKNNTKAKTFWIACLTLLVVTSARAATPFAGTWKAVRPGGPFDPGASDLVIESSPEGLRVSPVINPTADTKLSAAKVSSSTIDAEQGAAVRSRSRMFKPSQSPGARYEMALVENERVIQEESLEIRDKDRLTRSVTLLDSKGGRSNSVYYYRRGSKEKNSGAFDGHWKLDPQETKSGFVPQILLITESGNSLSWTEPTSRNRLTIDLKNRSVRMSGAAPKDLAVTVERHEKNLIEIGFTVGSNHGTNVYEVSEDDFRLTVRSTSYSAEGKIAVKSYEYLRQ